MSKVGRYTYFLSNRKGKKLYTVVNGKQVHFGASGMEHYYDRTGLLPKVLNHKDTKRRERYRRRHGAIKLKNGKLAINDPGSPAYHSLRILW